MPLDTTHFHTSDQIVRADDPHTPINPDGGGGVPNPFTEDVDAGGFRLTNLADPVDLTDAVRLDTLSLANVLNVGNDASGLVIENLADPTDPQDAATKAYVDENAGGLLPNPGASWVAETAVVDGDRIGASGKVFEASGDGTTDVSEPDWDSVLPSDLIADGSTDWTYIGHPSEVPFDAIGGVVPALIAAATVRTAEGVPSGAPVAGEVPFAFDTTAVTGGFYYWDGAAWVKVATIL